MSLTEYRILPLAEYNYLIKYSQKSEMGKNGKPNLTFVINACPKHIQNSVKDALEYLVDHPHFSFNSNGEVKIKNNVIQNSNITQIMIGLFTKSKGKTSPPLGLDYVKALLKSNDESEGEGEDVVDSKPSSSSSSSKKKPSSLFSNWESF